MKKSLTLILLAVFMFAAGCDNVTVSTGALNVVNMRMSLSKEGPALTERKIKRGVPAYILFTVTGIKQADDDQVWVQEDLAINGPDGKAVLSKENIMDMHSKAVKGANEVSFKNNLTLPSDAPLGEYEASIKVRDKNSGGTTSTTFKFTVEV